MMSKDTSTQRIDIIAAEAAEWLLRMREADAASKRDFAAWLQTSPEHVREFLAVAALWESMPGLPASPSVDELVAAAADDGNVVSIAAGNGTDGGVRSPRRRARTWVGVAAAAVVLAIVVGEVLTFMPAPSDPNLYATAIGEQRSVSLPDGSVVTLNTQSALHVDYSEGFRDIRLLRGEALFEVAKNPDRPFRVFTDRAVIQAVGTQFNVRRDEDDVTVTVVEGVVDVEASAAVSSRSTGQATPDGAVAELPVPEALPVRLTVGQQAIVHARSGEVAILDARVSKATAWRERRLVFESLSLKEVIDEFNRYNNPPLVIDDAELGKLPISGVFRANDRESFVQFLSQMKLANSTTRPDGTIVLRSMTPQ